MFVGIDDAHAQEVARLIEHAADSADGEPTLTSLKAQLDTVYARYVMDEQRDVHARTLNQRGTKAPPVPARKKSNIELF